MKLSDYIVEFMVRKGVNHFFGYQGTMIAHLVDSIEKNQQAKSHSSYHEQGAAFAACGYAQAKDACACAYATSGPGAINLLSGVANAYYDSVPVIFLTGQLNTYEYSGIEGLRQQGFQETDIVSMAATVTKYAVQIREPEDIVYELNKAWMIANSGRRGPVLIDLPMDVQRGEVKEPVYDMEIEAEQLGVPGEADRAAEAVWEALGRSERPAILMGQGVGCEGRKLLLRLASKLRLPVITSVLEKSALSYDDPMNFGCIGGAYGHRYANMIANAKSDLLLCFGISLCTRQIGTKVNEFAKNAEIIRVDIDRHNLKRRIHKDGEREQSFCADAAETLRILDEKYVQETDRWSEWLSVCRKIREELAMVDDNTPERYPNRMVGDLSDLLADYSAVAVDVGQHMVWSYQSFRNRKGQKLLFSGGHGAMGYALPAAAGAYYATGKPVACICGDGALQMSIQELEWVKRENIPIKIIVMNNGALGMIRHLQRDYFDCRFAGTSNGCGFSSCSFRKVAEAYGIPAVWAESGQASVMAKDILLAEGPGLLEIGLEQETFAYPKTCLGEPIHNQQPYAPKEIYDRILEM